VFAARKPLYVVALALPAKRQKISPSACRDGSEPVLARGIHVLRAFPAALIGP